MQLQLLVSQVRSHRNTCSASTGSVNSTQTLGKSRFTSGTGASVRRRGAGSVSGMDVGSGSGVRLGVLDVGSNTVHLLVVDAHHGAAPRSAYSYKTELRLAEFLDADGGIAPGGIAAL